MTRQGPTRRSWARWCAVVLAGAGAAHASAPLGEAPAVTWDVPPGCAGLVGAGTPSPSPLPSPPGEAPSPRGVSGTVRVAASGGRWALELAVSAPVQGRRALLVDTCGEALAAARFLLRLAAAGGPLTMPDASASERAWAGLTSPPLTSASDLTSASSWHGAAVFALGGARLLALPKAQPWTGALLWLERGRGGLAVGLGTGLGDRFPGGPNPTSQALLWPVADAHGGPCAVWSPAAVQVAGCLEAQVSWWRLRGLHVSAPRESDALFAAAGPTVRVLLPAGDRLVLLAGVSARFTLVGPRASFATGPPVVGAGVVSIGLELGLGLRAAPRGGPPSSRGEVRTRLVTARPPTAPAAIPGAPTVPLPEQVTD